MTPDGNRTWFDAKIESLEDEINRLRQFQTNTQDFIATARNTLNEVNEAVKSSNVRLRVLEDIELKRAAQYGLYGTLGGAFVLVAWELFKYFFLK